MLSADPTILEEKSSSKIQSVGKMMSPKSLLLFYILLSPMTSFVLRNDDQDYRSVVPYDSVHEVMQKQNYIIQKRNLYTAVLITQGTLSAGFDIYKYERGYKDYPGFTKNLKKIDKLLKSLSNLQKEVNLAWSPVVNINGYYDRMESYLTILDEHLQKFSTLQKVLFSTLDSESTNRLNETTYQVLRDIEAKNVTYVVDTDKLTEKFMAKLTYAFRLIANLEPLVKGIGTSLVNRMGKMYAQSTAASTVNKNPSAFRNFVNNLSEKKAALSGWVTSQKEAFKTQIKTKFQNFLSRHSRLQSAWTRLAGSQQAKARWTKVGNGLKVAAKGLYLGGYLAYDIYLGVKFFKKCADRTKQAKKIVRNLTAEKNMMKEMLLNISNLEETIKTHFFVLKSELTNDSFIQYINNIYEHISNASTNQEVLKNIKTLNEFTEKIDSADVSYTDELTNNLLTALANLNTEISCLVAQVKVSVRGIHDCLHGHRTVQEIFENERTDQGLNVCKNYTLNYANYSTSIRNEMISLNLQTNCLLNSNKYKLRICSDWYKDVSDGNIAQKYMLTTEEVDYVLSGCALQEVAIENKRVICADKKNKTLNEIKAAFSKFIQSQVESAYKSCYLSKTQNEAICAKKSQSISYNTILSEYQNYGDDGVKKAYDACPESIPPGLQYLVCYYKSIGMALNSDALQQVAQDYSSDLVTDIYNNKC